MNTIERITTEFNWLQLRKICDIKPTVADDHVRVAVEGVAEEERQEGEELVQKGMHLLQGIQIQTDGGLAGGAEQD